MMNNSGTQKAAMEGGGRPDLLVLPVSSASSSLLLAAKSDNVHHLPHDIPSNVLLLFSNCRPKSKELYLALCNNPVLIDDGKMSFQLDKWSGKKCYMISPRNLTIMHVDNPKYWRWISDLESRFEEVPELLDVCWLQIIGSLNTRLLSKKTLYKAYLVFKFTVTTYGFEDLIAEMSVGLVGGETTMIKMLLDNKIGNDEDTYPKERSDGWLELEMGEFFNEGGEDGKVDVNCLANGRGNWKKGLIVQGIEFRPQHGA